jgi:hypothetical protein
VIATDSGTVTRVQGVGFSAPKTRVVTRLNGKNQESNKIHKNQAVKHSKPYPLSYRVGHLTTRSLYPWSLSHMARPCVDRSCRVAHNWRASRLAIGCRKASHPVHVSHMPWTSKIVCIHEAHALVAFDRALCTQNWGTFVMPTTRSMICRNTQSSQHSHRLFLSEADRRCCDRDVILRCTLLCLPPLRVRRCPFEKLAFAPGFELQVPQPTITRATACYWTRIRARTSHRRSLFYVTRPKLGQRPSSL